jgi:hypothetical protein
MPDYRPGLWKIEFTAGDRDADGPREYARQAAVADATLGVVQAGRYRFAAVGTHEQVIALRDVVIGAGGESFSITRAIMAELYPRETRVRYDGDDPEGLRQKARQQLGLDPAEDNRWETAAEFWCPAELLDVVLHDYSQWQLRQEDAPGKEPVGGCGESS